jgi:hypothetical protein
MIARRERERERRSLGFSPMVSLGGGAAEMVTRLRSTEATDEAPMGRWFWAQGREIGVWVGAMNNGGTLITPFIWL